MDGVQLIVEQVYIEETPDAITLAALNEPDELSTSYNTVDEMMRDLLSDVDD